MASSRSGVSVHQLGRQPCRLIVDEPADGAWNMTFDEALLEAAAAENAAGGHMWSLRFYGWSTPTLSLGYFQNWEDRQQHQASLGCPCVRRSSGGGAIVHDRELTYSLAVPGGQKVPLQPATLYQLMHQALVESLQEVANVVAVLHAAARRPTATAQEPFLCFQRRAAGDVLIDRAKIAGSAQRRLRGAVLQHGSVLLHTSAAAPELAGVSTLAPVTVRGEELQNVWAARLGAVLGLEYLAAGDLQAERQTATRIVRDKFACDGWNRRR